MTSPNRSRKPKHITNPRDLAAVVDILRVAKGALYAITQTLTPSEECSLRDVHFHINQLIIELGARMHSPSKPLLPPKPRKRGGK